MLAEGCLARILEMAVVPFSSLREPMMMWFWGIEARSEAVSKPIPLLPPG
jgi:hypothetical protein